jgi:hypothetical protein
MNQLRVAAAIVVIAAGAIVGNAVVTPKAGGPGAYRPAIGRPHSAQSSPYLICAADSRC